MILDYYDGPDLVWCPFWAYMFGLLFADGHLQHENRRIVLTTIDKQLVNMICAVVPSARARWYSSQGTEGVYKLSLHRDVSTFMHKNGFLVGNRVGKLEWPKSLPIEFARDFVRGFFDGDGSAGSGFSVQFCSRSYRFLSSLEVIGCGLYCAPHDVYEGKTCYKLAYDDIVDAAKWAIYMYLYPTTDICLLRKRNRLFAARGIKVSETPNLRGDYSGYSLSDYYPKLGYPTENKDK